MVGGGVTQVEGRGQLCSLSLLSPSCGFLRSNSGLQAYVAHTYWTILPTISKYFYYAFLNFTDAHFVYVCPHFQLPTSRTHHLTSLKISLTHSCVHFLLWPTKINQGHLCNCVFGTINWRVVGTEEVTQDGHSPPPNLMTAKSSEVKGACDPSPTTLTDWLVIALV